MKDIKCVGFKQIELDLVSYLVHEYLETNDARIAAHQYSQVKVFHIHETATQIVLRKQ